MSFRPFFRGYNSIYNYLGAHLVVEQLKSSSLLSESLGFFFQLQAGKRGGRKEDYIKQTNKIRQIFRNVWHFSFFCCCWVISEVSSKRTMMLVPYPTLLKPQTESWCNTQPGGNGWVSTSDWMIGRLHKVLKCGHKLVATCCPTYWTLKHLEVHVLTLQRQNIDSCNKCKP